MIESNKPTFGYFIVKKQNKTKKDRKVMITKLHITAVCIITKKI